LVRVLRKCSRQLTKSLFSLVVIYNFVIYFIFCSSVATATTSYPSHNIYQLQHQQQLQQQQQQQQQGFFPKKEFPSSTVVTHSTGGMTDFYQPPSSTPFFNNSGSNSDYGETRTMYEHGQQQQQQQQQQDPGSLLPAALHGALQGALQDHGVLGAMRNIRRTFINSPSSSNSSNNSR
jgi:hypothetical protein